MPGGERALPSLVGRITVDTAGLTKAEAEAKAATSKIGGHVSSVGVISKDTEQKIAGLSSKLGQLGPIGQVASGGIGKLSSVLAGSLGPIALGGAAMAALGGVAIEGMNKYLALASSVEHYMRVTGESAPIASAQVQAFAELGVGADVASAAMFKLSKAVETAPKHLAALGIEVAKDAKGNVDLNATLMNVIDAWNGTEDAAKRNLIAFTAFGKGGAALIPILQEGSAKLKQLEADVRVTLTDADIAQAHKYELQHKQVTASFDAMTEDLGRHVIPILGDLSNEYLKNEYVAKRMKESNQQAVISFEPFGGRMTDLKNKFGQQFDAAQRAAAGIAQQTDAMTQAAAAAKALDDEMVTLFADTEKEADQSLRVAHALLNEERGVKNVDAATDALSVAIKKYGANSEEAKNADLALREARQSQLDTVISVAKAEQTLSADRAKAGGVALTTAENQKVYLDSLDKELAKLAPGSPLRVALQGYIDQLGRVPTTISTQFSTSLPYSGTARQQKNLGRDAGGPVLPGLIYDVGETSKERLTMFPGGGGFVTPNPGGGRGSADDRPIHVAVAVDIPVLLDGAVIARVVNEKRYARGRGVTG